MFCHSPCGGGMSKNVAANGFLRICRKHGCSINLCHNLVAYDYGDTKLLRHKCIGVKVQKDFFFFFTFGRISTLVRSSSFLPHLQAWAACGGIVLDVLVSQTALPSLSNLFCTEQWHCPRSTERTCHSRGDKECMYELQN